MKLSTSGGSRRGGLFRDGQSGVGERERHRPRLRRSHGVARSQRRSGPHPASGGRRRQGLESLRREPRFHGKIQREQQQQHLSGTRGKITGRRLCHARLLQQHGVLRIGGKPAFRRSRSPTQSCPPAPRRTRQTVSDIPARLPASRQMAPATGSSGRSRTAAPQCSTPTMPSP